MDRLPEPVEPRNVPEPSTASAEQGGAEAFDAAQYRIDAFHDRVAQTLVYPYALDRDRNIIQRRAERPPFRDICAPILVTDLVQGSTGHASVLRVEMLADDGKIEVLDIPNEDLGSSAPLADVQLRRAGLHIPASARDMSALLRSFRPRIVRGADVPPGWHPSGKLIFGLRDGRAVVPKDMRVDQAMPFIVYRPDVGKVRIWKDRIARFASGNPYVLFGLCLALSGPMLQLTGRSGFGFNLVSGSSRGKSTLLKLMAGVWPDMSVEGWNNSDAGLEDICRKSHGSLLLLDELPRVGLDPVIDAIYMIMNGRPRNVRRDKDLSAHQTRPPDWAMPMFSNSEARLSDLVARQGKRLPEGAQVRMIELVPRTLWEDHHGHGSAYDLLKRLESALPETTGVAGPMFVRSIAGIWERDKDRVLGVHARTQRFLENELGVDRATASGMLMRSLETFACVATAGQFAGQVGLLPQSPQDVREAVLGVAKAWADPDAGADAAHSEALDRLRNWLARYAEARLVELDERGAPIGRARVADGWKTAQSYLLLKETFRSATRLEGNTSAFLRHLHERGILRRSGQPNSMQVRMGPAVHGRPWVYRIDRLALAQDDGEPEG